MNYNCRVISSAMGSHCQIKTISREPIPNYIDSITKKLKYVDPGHRQCVPGFKAASFTPANPADKYNGRTHNCIATVTMYNGDRYSYMHPHKMTGFKAPNAYGRTPLFDDLTTNNYFSHLVRKVGEEMDHNSKKLCPYHMDANRNMPRAFSHNDVGLHCFDRRNASYIRLESGDRKDMKTPLSTHKRFHCLPRNKTGLSNPGIFAEKTALMHKHQMGENHDEIRAYHGEPCHDGMRSASFSYCGQNVHQGLVPVSFIALCSALIQGGQPRCYP